MRGLLCIALVCLGAFSSAHGQSTEKDKPELFRSYLDVSTPTVKGYIPTATCRAIISQAERIVASPEALKSVDRHDLQVASVNLRTCATSELARLERDL